MGEIPRKEFMAGAIVKFPERSRIGIVGEGGLWEVLHHDFMARKVGDEGTGYSEMTPPDTPLDGPDDEIDPGPMMMMGRAPGAEADPWAHRSEGMRCRTCMYYVEKAADVNMAPIKAIGRCRRHAPTMSGYPAVYPTDWCGDHKVDETK